MVSNIAPVRSQTAVLTANLLDRNRGLGFWRLNANPDAKDVSKILKEQMPSDCNKPEVVSLVVVSAVPLRLPGVVELALVGARRRLGVTAARSAAAALVGLTLK